MKKAKIVYLTAVLLVLAVIVTSISTTGTLVYAADSAPNWSDDACYGSGNPLTAGYKYNCTWYAWGRAREIMGVKMNGNTKKWVNSSTTGGYTELPSTNSIAVYINTSSGWIYHVAYVENFDGTYVTYSEGNSWLGTGVQKYHRDTMELITFEQKTLSWVKGANMIKYIPLGSSFETVGPTPPSSVASGTLKNGITWSYQDGVLSFEGSGTIEIDTMPDKPWQSYLSSIKTIRLSSGITGIGDYVFDNKDINNLNFATQIVGGENVTTIGRNAFYRMANLENWPFTSKLTSIGIDAFSDCHRISGTLDLSNVTSIGAGALNAMKKVEKVIWSDKLTELPYGAFYSMDSLTELDLHGARLTKLGGQSLSYVSLTSFTIPDTVTFIGEACFTRSKLTTITIPASVTSIEDRAFGLSSSLKTVYFLGSAPSYRTSIYSEYYPVSYYPADDSTWTETIRSELGGSSAVWKAYTTYSLGKEQNGSLNSDGYADMYRVTIPQKGYYDMYIGTASSSSGSIEVTKDPSELAQWSGSETNTWSTLYLDAGTYYIKINKSSYSFTLREHYGHTNAAAKFPCGLHVCDYCGESYHVPHTEGDWIVDVAATTSQEGSKHTICVICGETVDTQTIPKLTSTSLEPDTTPSDFDPDTDDKPSNSDIDPPFVPGDDSWDFDEESLGNQLDVGDEITTISGATFEVLSSNTVMFSALTMESETIVIPNTVTDSYGNVYNVTKIAANAFRGDTTLRRISMGTNMKSIGSRAFYGCTKLTSVTIGNNVTTIGIGAFQSCTSLKKLTIPAKVTTIGSNAFYNCKAMTALTINSAKLTTSKIGSNAFTKTGSSNYAKLVVTVPSSKASAYKNAFQARGLSKRATFKKA